MTGPRPLGSTYRLQLRPQGFDWARQLVSYLDDLGVETLYVSPIFAAVPGSAHGYDVVDPTRLDPELGTPEQFEALLDELDRHGMRLLVDVVPNHMATDAANAWWWDVLRLGQASPYGAFFDIDWQRHSGRVLLAVLDAPISSVLSRRAPELDPALGTVSVAGQRFPIDPARAADVDWMSLLSAQHYRLAFWRLGLTENNYRRFFDIGGLIGVRLEDPAVYAVTQRGVLGLLADPRVAGVRIDHIDGLADPTTYLRRLRSDIGGARSTPVLLVEKILGRGEEVPEAWPVEGTTGYEFARLATAVLVDETGASALERLYGEWMGEDRAFSEVEREAKREVLRELFASEVTGVGTLALRALDASGPGHDLSVGEVEAALLELTACLSVYRTYFDEGPARPVDLVRVRAAARAAHCAVADETARALVALELLITAQIAPPGTAAAQARLAFVRCWQQLTTVAAAKGSEDTALYRFAGVPSAAEVGADPDRPASPVEELHRALERRARRTPGTLNAGSTHDTKRSADARARLAVLSELPEEWGRLLSRWRRRHRAGTSRDLDPRDELCCYESLLALWPAPGEQAPRDLRVRVADAVCKSAREAKRRTGWIDPDLRYERTLGAFVGRVLRDARTRADLDRLLRRIGPAAAANSLALVLLASGAPGVPDLYQGDELFRQALVDPDNRRPVDFEGRRRALAASSLGRSTDERRQYVQALLERWSDGRIKVLVVAACLRTRRSAPAVFAAGRYQALDVSGPGRSHVVAFARRHGRSWVIVVLARRSFSLAGPGRFPVGARVWDGTRLGLPEAAPRRFVDAFSLQPVAADAHGSIAVGAVLDLLPVALLCGPGVSAGR